MFKSVIYVDAKAKGSGDGTSWQKAFTDLTSALLNSKRREIWVAAGTYKPGKGTDTIGSTFLIDSGTAIYGGFFGRETERYQAQPNTNITTLSGDIGKSGDFKDNVNTVVTTTDENTIDGFQITGGYCRRDWAGGVLGVGNLNISRCVFIENRAISSTGALTLFNGNPNVHECIFTRNTGSNAGAINAANSSPAIMNCAFHENVSDRWGGAILFQVVGNGVIANSTFYGNSAPMGSAVAIVAGEPGFHSKVEIGNSIFWKNQFKGVKGDRESEIIVEQVNLDNSVEFHIASSIVQGGTNPASTGIRIKDATRTQTELESIQDVDPKFLIEKQGGDLLGSDKQYFTNDDGLNIQFGSPAMNAGMATPIVSIDILGHPRSLGKTVDIGAYEHW